MVAGRELRGGGRKVIGVISDTHGLLRSEAAEALTSARRSDRTLANI